jgi:tetratricopeptide (TPR) repeat protein
MNKIADDYFYLDNDKMYEFAQQALELSESINYKTGIAEAYNNLGIFYRSKGIYDLAIDYTFNSLAIMEQIKNIKGIGRCYNLIGIIYYYLQNYQLSLEYYNKALQINIAQNDKKWIAGNYNNVGMIYEKTDEYSKSLEYYFKSLETSIELNNKNWIANNYGNIGSLYQVMGNPKSLEYFFKRLELTKESADISGIATSNYLIGKYLNSQNQQKEAISYLEKGFILADSLGFLFQANNVAKELSIAYAGISNFRKAYRYHVIHKKLNDSLNLEENAQKITRLEMQYKFKKDQQLSDLKYQKTELLGILIAVLLVLLILVSLLIIGRQRARAKQNELEQKKLYLGNKLLQEELQFKDQTLQDNVKYLVNKNDLITAVSEKLISEKPNFKKENQKIIEEVIIELQSNIDSDIWEEFEIRFNLVHSDFYVNLNNYAPNLSANDKKLCAFLKLNMTTREISSITRQSSSSIETARTRLRKKLNISNKDLTLQEFLNQF